MTKVQFWYQYLIRDFVAKSFYINVFPLFRGYDGKFKVLNNPGYEKMGNIEINF